MKSSFQKLIYLSWWETLSKDEEAMNKHKIEIINARRDIYISSRAKTKINLEPTKSFPETATKLISVKPIVEPV